MCFHYGDVMTNMFSAGESSHKPAYNRSEEFLAEFKNVNNAKKLLYFLRQLEVSPGLKNSMSGRNGLVLKNKTFIPTNEVLVK